MPILIAFNRTITSLYAREAPIDVLRLLDGRLSGYAIARVRGNQIDLIRLASSDEWEEYNGGYIDVGKDDQSAGTP